MFSVVQLLNLALFRVWHISSIRIHYWIAFADFGFCLVRILHPLDIVVSLPPPYPQKWESIGLTSLSLQRIKQLKYLKANASSIPRLLSTKKKNDVKFFFY